MGLNICSVTVWYNPSLEEKENIKSYYGDIRTLIIVDNSEKNNSDLLVGLDKITYIPNMENLGIAKALNMGCEKAKELGFEWVLTMDQDSNFKTPIKEYIEKTLNMIEKDIKISLYAPIISESEEAGYADKVITSGNILNLKNYFEVEGFDNDFFIDEVDHDYCLKLIKKGYKIYKFKDVILNHKLGNSKKINLFGKKIVTMNHGYVRKYYISRNRFYMAERYPEYRKNYIKRNFIDLIKIVLGEDDKVRKMKYMIKGYLDYKRGKLGKL